MADVALLSRIAQEAESLSRAIESASARQARMLAQVENVEDVALLRRLKQRRAHKVKSLKQSADQIILSTTVHQSLRILRRGDRHLTRLHSCTM